MLLKVGLVGLECCVAQMEERTSAGSFGASDGRPSDQRYHGPPSDGLARIIGFEVHPQKV